MHIYEKQITQFAVPEMGERFELWLCAKSVQTTNPCTQSPVKRLRLFESSAHKHFTQKKNHLG